MIKVYVAGPYKANSEWETKQNIRNAEAVAVELWNKGYAVLCPHKNSAFLGGTAQDKIFLEGYLEFLKCCNFVILVGQWWKSSGTIKEIELALKLDISVFCSMDDFKKGKRLMEL